MPLRFRVVDRQNTPERLRLADLLDSLGLVGAPKGKECDVLAVHRKTDAPGKEGGIGEEDVHSVLRHGVFIEYTTGALVWETVRPSHVYIQHAELMRRLSRLRGTATIEDLRSALMAPLDKHVATVDTLSALAILCQGYLTSVARVDGTPTIEPNDEMYPSVAKALEKMGWKAMCESGADAKSLRRDGLVRRRQDVINPHWWTDVFMDRRPDLGELSETECPCVVRLLDRIWQSKPGSTGEVEGSLRIDPASVAQAYLELASLLEATGQERC